MVFLRMTYGVALGPHTHSHIKEYAICPPCRHIAVKRGKIFKIFFTFKCILAGQVSHFPPWHNTSYVTDITDDHRYYCKSYIWYSSTFIVNCKVHQYKKLLENVFIIFQMNPADGQCLHTDSCEKFCQPFCIRGHDVRHWKHSGTTN